MLKNAGFHLSEGVFLQVAGKLNYAHIGTYFM